MEAVSFEARIEKAKEILSKLNTQNLNLKEGLNLYKEGMQELQEAQSLLEKAKLEYQELKSIPTQSEVKQ
ncbi:exodeoxyribonuclease VII small subunit [Helicobacter sp. 12S02634-8]|uniref:exodeoxyribonuclease VII small subunit n=1 Tax=Helicobacter sp. 12S02634-8 TaxID=1476199 RepID=UPI000BA4E7C5|nr:exodeoxyribonuclease VII small subunit [Helicobacter sp. 12S02634-8]